MATKPWEDYQSTETTSATTTTDTPEAQGPWSDYTKAEAKGPWEDYKPKTEPKIEGAPLLGGEPQKVVTGPTPNWSRDSTPEAGGTWGLDPENAKALEFLRSTPQGEQIYQTLNLGARALDVGQDIGHKALVGIDSLSDASGLADALSWDGNKFHPGAAIGALTEAFPEGNLSHGIGGPTSVAAAADRGAIRNLLQGKLEAGATRAEMDAALQEATGNPTVTFGGDLDAAIAYRDDPANKGKPPPLLFDKDIQAEAKLKAEADAFKPKPETTAEDAFPTEERLKAREEAMAAKLTQEAEDFKNRPAEAVSEPQGASKGAPEAVRTTADDIVDTVNDSVSEWKNPPRFEVHESFDNVDGLDKDALGAYDAETGAIKLNAKAIEDEAVARGLTQKEMTNTVVFHEGLGHFGLNQRFKAQLDNILTGYYKSSVEFKDLVDEWKDKNPEAYADDINPLARAGEEVLAEMSENGKLPPKIMNTVKNYVKSVARKMGMNLDYSLREIKTILSQIHDDVVSGSPANHKGSGLRTMKPYDKATLYTAQFFKIPPERIAKALTESDFKAQVQLTRTKMERGTLPELEPDYRYMMRRYGKESKGPLQTSDNMGKIRSKENIEEILDEAAPEKTKESWDQWIDEAGRIKTNGRAELRLAEGVEVPELLAARKFAIESANRIKSLSRKAATGATTERENYILGQELKRLENVRKSISEVVGNAGRILNSQKIEVSSDKALTDNMLRMMSKVDFDDPVAVAAASKKLEKMGKRAEQYKKLLDVVGNAINLPRSLVASADLSAPFNQGAFLMGRKEFWKNLPDMFRQAWSPSFARAVEDSIKESPTYPLMKKAGLEISTLGVDLTKREEQFMSVWAEKIPVAGRLVKGSERAYTGFLNKLRADTFTKLVKSYEKAGIDINDDIKLLRGIAHYVNNATGRGDLGKFNQAAPVLSGLLFSPRLMASRVRMLNPLTYSKMDSVVRKEALGSLASFGGIVVTAAMLAKMAGADVEIDPRSSDFAKIKVGNTRYNLTGGFSQYLTLAARVRYNQKKNVKGEIEDLGKGYGKDDITDVVKDFGLNKASPLASFLIDWRRGKNAIGEPFDTTTTDLTKNAIATRLIPLFMQDATELIRDEGAKGIPMSLPGLFGVGMSTYATHLGYDAFGRDIKKVLKSDKEESDPAVLEVQRLNSLTDTPVLREAPKSIRADGKTEKLDEAQVDQFQKTMGTYVKTELDNVLDTPEWLALSDEEKIEEVKAIHKEGYDMAKQEYLEGGSD